MWAALRTAATSATRAAAAAAAPHAGGAIFPRARPSLLGLGNLPYARWFKTVSSLKKRWEDCYIVRRGKITYNYCKTPPRPKQRQGARCWTTSSGASGASTRASGGASP